MPPIADELHLLSPHLASWHAYDRTARVELCSTAIITRDGLSLIDPIDLSGPALGELEKLGPVTSILLTNVNHQRASDSLARKYKVAIYGPKELIDAETGIEALVEGSIYGLEVIKIDGAAVGEVAVYDRRGPGALIIGDALINFEPYGFTLLPRKYCTNHKQMNRSLRQLLDLQFEQMLFAHGVPIMTRAREKLVSLMKAP